MPGWLVAFFSFLQGVIGLLLEQKGEELGRAKAEAEARIETKKEIDLAKKSEDLASDPVRTERLRRKYDRASKLK